MLKIDWNPFQRLAVLLCLALSASRVELALAQQYHSPPGAAPYTNVNANPVASPARFSSRPRHRVPPVQSSGTTRQRFMVASQPVLTSVEVPAAPSPPQRLPPAPNIASQPERSPPTPNISPPPSPRADSRYSVPPPSGFSAPHYGTAQPYYAETKSEQPCDWFCRLQKKLRSLGRASHRRSECHFEYPVMIPTGRPYGYVQPTWSDFHAEPAAYPVKPTH